MTTEAKSAVSETRTFSVTCRRRIVEACLLERGKRSDRDNVRSLSTAEAAFREDGWTLHTDGTASCPRCIAAWEDGYGVPGHDLEEGPQPVDVDAAQDEALRVELEGDGGLGEELARKADR